MSPRYTGRAVVNKKWTVDDVRSLDILALQKAGIFHKGPSMTGTVNWRQGDQSTRSVAFQLIHQEKLPFALKFQYTITDRIGESRESLDYPIQVTSTRCHLGGVRWWFICPLVVNGKRCGRRCRILYLPNGAKYFGCRECYELTYESRQRHRQKFYEEFLKPMQILESLAEKPTGRESTATLLKRYRKYEKAEKKIYEYMHRSFSKGGSL